MGRGGYNGGSTVIHAGSGWFGKGSVTSQPGEKKKRPPTPGKSKRNKKVSKAAPPISTKGNGLTLAEIVAKAARRVRSLEGEIAKTRKRLATLERDHALAVIDSEKARNLPRKTATGAALHAAEQSRKAATSNDARKKAERAADCLARENYRNAPKEVEVEHRVAGALVAKRVVTRS